MFLVAALVYLLAVIVARLYNYVYTVAYGGVVFYNTRPFESFLNGLPGLQYALLINEYSNFFLIGLGVLFFLVVVSP